MIKKVFLGIIAGFILILTVAILAYKKEVKRVMANPQQVYSEGLMQDSKLTALHISAWDGDYNKTSQLIQQGQSIYAKTGVFEFTPFHMAIFKGHTQVADLLLSKGANINEVSNFNQTALHWAAFMGETASVKFLIQKGADLEKLTDQGTTALHSAALMGNLEIVKLLIRNGALSSKKTKNGQTAKDLAKSNGKKEVARFLSSI